MKLEDLNVAIYADGADLHGMMKMYQKGFVKGFTTNPTLMKKAGVTSYTEFVREAVRAIPDRPISFEVFANDFETMKAEALALTQYGGQIFVKIPITNANGESSVPLISALSKEGIRLNVTAVFTLEQVRCVVDAFEDNTQNIVSLFAGRIADAGVDPEPVMRKTAELCGQRPGTKSLWASCREVFNIVQADRCGVDIITVTNDLFAKIECLGKDLDAFSLETVRMFERDGKGLGFSILS